MCAVACTQAAPSATAETLRLVRPRLAGGSAGVYQQDVYLNEELRFYFSADVDRTSVTRDSVRITSEHGVPADGSFSVERDCVRFVPKLPLLRDLTDAGLRPGTRYRVEIAGFPWPDGVRSTSGRPLAASLAGDFTTVAEHEAGGAPRTWLLFDDRLQARPGLVKFFPPRRAKEAYVTPLGGALLVVSDKPIDPTTLSAENFDFRRRGDAQPLALDVRLVENAARALARPRPAPENVSAAGARSAPLRPCSVPDGLWEQTPRAAVLELVPREPTDPRETYQLTIRTDATGQLATLRDFSGQPLVSPRSYSTIDVRFERTGNTGPAAEYVEDFLRTTPARARLALAVPGCDGTPVWDDTGRVEVRYPAAAGDGEAGEVELGARETRNDVSATRIVLPSGVTCALEAGDGPCVLRAQGSLRIAGALVRRGPAATGADIASRDPELFYDGKGSRPVATLSAWLARQLATPGAGSAADPATPSGATGARRALPWTILIAGGDLVVDGSIEVDTPLLLVAGGVVRVTGHVRGRQDDEIGQVWILGDGGGLDIKPRVNLVRRGLALDPPIGANPLRTPLRLCAMSDALPSESGRVARWRGADVRGSRPLAGIESSGSEERGSQPNTRSDFAGGRDGANGTWRVRFLTARDIPPGPDFRARWVDDPQQLPITDGSGGRLVFFVELEVPVGGSWSPPFVDRLRVSWDPLGER